jgi:mono/diheme cytochrome c family protein
MSIHTTFELFNPAVLNIANVGTTVTAAAHTSIDPAFLKAGQQQFLLCAACHGQSGEGTAVAPPLAGSEWINGPSENLIRIQLRGLLGPIKVKGQDYNLTGGMASLAYQTDDQIAAVLTYVRQSFGNSAPPVTPGEVKALRSEVGKPQVSPSALIPPTKKESSTSTGSQSLPSGKYDNIEPASSPSVWTGLLIAAVIVIGLILIRKFGKK